MPYLDEQQQKLSFKKREGRQEKQKAISGSFKAECEQGSQTVRANPVLYKVTRF